MNNNFAIYPIESNIWCKYMYMYMHACINLLYIEESQVLGLMHYNPRRKEPAPHLIYNGLSYGRNLVSIVVRECRIVFPDANTKTLV